MGKADFLSLQILPDGSLLTGGWFGANVWDATSGALLRTLFDGDGGVNWETRASHDGSRIAAGFGDLSFYVWEGSSGRLVQKHEERDGIVISVSFSRTGVILTGQPQKKLCFWDAASGDLTRELKAKKSICWRNAIAPDATLAISAGQTEKSAHLWDLQTNTEVATLSAHAKAMEHLAMDPRGGVAATGARDGTVRLSDVSAKGATLRAVIVASKKAVTGLAYAPHGGLLASAGEDGRVCVWDTATGALVHALDAPSGLTSVAFAPDAKTVAASGDRRVYFWAV